MTEHKTLGAILFNDFELLDLAGPLEMFGSLGKDLRTVMIAENAGEVRSVQGPAMLADTSFDAAPDLDLLLIPGGLGSMAAQENSALLKFLQERGRGAELIMSVCTGSAILAAAGVLDGLAATSNKLFFDLARSQSDKVDWREQARWVEDGKVFTSSGVSAGTDMALAAIQRLYGNERAEQIAVMTEYNWHKDASDDPFYHCLDQGDLQQFVDIYGRV